MTATNLKFSSLFDADQMEFDGTCPSNYTRALDEAAALGQAVMDVLDPASFFSRIVALGAVLPIWSATGPTISETCTARAWTPDRASGDAGCAGGAVRDGIDMGRR